MAWGDGSGWTDAGSWDTSGGTTWDASTGIDPSLIGADGQPIVPPIPPAGGPPDLTWGQQLGNWLGISPSNQTAIAGAVKELKSGLGDIKQIADPLAPKPGQVATAGGLPPSQTRPAQSLDEVLQQLYQRRQQLASLGLSGQGWQPRNPGGGLLGVS